MDTGSLVGERINSGALLLRGLKDAGVQVVSAGWIKGEDDARWVLYLCLPMADKEGRIASYSAVQRVGRSSEAIQLDISDVVIVGEAHPITKGMLGLRVPKGAPVELKPTLIGHVLANAVYVYPLDDKKDVRRRCPQI